MAYGEYTLKNAPAANGNSQQSNSQTNNANETMSGGETDRGQWGSQVEFLLACVGYAVGLGNVWRFPYLCYVNGGGAFLVPYVISLLLAGLPIFYMELAIGQFSSLGANVLFSKLSPLFTGVGWAMCTISFTCSIYYNVIIAWTVLYLVLSFRGTLLWDTCTAEWNTYRCTSNRADAKCALESNNTLPLFYNFTCWANNSEDALSGRQNLIDNNITVSPSEEFFNNFVYALKPNASGDSLTFSDLGGIQWYLILSLFVCWIIIFLCLIKGVQSTGKVVYFTATFPYVVLVILLIRGVTLEGASTGIMFYLKPDPAKIIDISVWKAAATQIFYSLGPAFGSLLTMSSYNKFNNNCYRDALIVAFTNCGTSVFAGFAIFSTLGFMALDTNKDISEVVASGPSLAFIAYPEAIVRMPCPPIWSILFFFMLFTLGLDSQFAMVETVTTAFLDQFPSLRRRKWAVVGTACVVMFLLGIPMTLGGGIYIFTLFDYYCASYGLMLIACLEAIVVFHVYGIGNFCRDVEMMLGVYPSTFAKIIGPIGIYWKIMWMFVAPVLLAFIFVMSFVGWESTSYNNYVFPSSAETFGWILAAIPIAWIPGFAIYRLAVWAMCHNDDPIMSLIKSTEDWGPEHIRNAHSTYEMKGTYKADTSKTYPVNNDSPPDYNNVAFKS